ncbi:Sulfite reduction-associated complex DsrMKJOP iron-sulfur protein DsrO (=HmeA) [hydrothermal vent metagenome]|uniref:Sulfite reduction-associated complex DsrMKJOP iron-sulfur protein DsrO (=HmeA) n=1 Tax=hydrothermal vent metagenome TaxID=652676 RepID=A0A3B1ABJ8_9ZZZZ
MGNSTDNNNNQIDHYRRKFLSSSSTAIAGLVVAPGVLLTETAQAKPANEAVTDKKRWGLLVDTNKCGNGCTDCVTACNTENGLTSNNRPLSDAQWIRKVKVTDKRTKHSMELPIMCQHCETAPCVDVCPTAASFKRADGIVLVDKHLCIGCRYCMMACPYKARSFVHEVVQNQKPYAPRGKGTVESCTMCVHRVDTDGTPACVEACSQKDHNAMLFGDLNDPTSEISKSLKKHGGTQIRADLGLNQGVFYQGI